MHHSYLTNPEINLETIIVDTPRCTIEPFRIEWIDFEDFTQAFCRANENLYISPFLPSIEQEREYITSAIECRRNSQSFECFIFDKESKELIGSIGISDLEKSEPNLGLWIRKEYQGQWFATEIYRAMLEWAKMETNFEFFKHAVNPENTASIRLAEKFNGKLQDALGERWQLKYYIYLK